MKAAANKWTEHCPAQVVNKLLEHKKEKKNPNKRRLRSKTILRKAKQKLYR